MGVINIDRIEQGQVLYYEQQKIKSLSAEILTFEDETVLHWDNMSDLNKLVNILVWVDNWQKVEGKNWISIKWSIYDFEELAHNNEKDQNLEPGTIYDWSKFHDALHLLENNHDCNNGISYTDIIHYLDYCCRL